MDFSKIEIVYSEKRDRTATDPVSSADIYRAEAERTLKNSGKCYFLSLEDTGNQTNLFLYSASYQTRAGDLLRYLQTEIPEEEIKVLLEENDTDFITSWCLASLPDKIAFHDVMAEKIREAVASYAKKSVIIDAGEYFAENRIKVEKLPVYRKKVMPRCCVSLKEIRDRMHLDDDTEIILQTLENESGVTLKCSDEVLIMIGTNGEPYDIRSEKFSELYEIMEEGSGEASVMELSKDYEMIPKAILKDSGAEINLLDYAVLCTSVKINQVYAEQISEGIYKVFSTRILGTNQYYLGGKGDWLTVDRDSPTSVHIVADIPFKKSYEKT